MKNVVTIGGGTGSYRVLRGIKNISGISISAIVSMADDGGSTGILRKELGVHPMGDARQCLAALTPSKDLHDFLKYRRPDGHAAGNFFLADLEKSAGSFEKGLDIAMKVLDVKGKIIPSTLDNAELIAILPKGEKVEGESNIISMNLKISDIERVFYKGAVKLNPRAALVIKEADYTIISPGAFYTSIVPNLITEGFKEALAKSKTKIIAVENLESEETDIYVDRLTKYLGKTIDNVIPGNLSLKSEETIVKEAGDTLARSIARHDSKKLAEVIGKIIKK